MEATMRRWTRRDLVRPQVRLPQLVGAVSQSRLHEPQARVELLARLRTNVVVTLTF